ncbi:GNAT family N-acetyltransferase [Deinococcus navajonensis]|uniref:GNAT family N-acetyltransferase n=1 Tax=Deinococcus navajonensis TaxID=309884 RepID=A0ABV8XM87_9DEIO
MDHLGGPSAGSLQWYWLVDSLPTIEGLCGPVGAAGLDVFMGEPTLLGQGVGSAAIGALIHEVLVGRYGVTRILIDPARTNTRAIRVYE